MDEPEDEEKQSQGVIKTVASPTVLAAILDESTEDKQTSRDLQNSPLQEKCLDSSEAEKNPPLGMDGGGQESHLVDSFVDDSLEFDEGLQDREMRKSEDLKLKDEASNSSMVEGGSTLREDIEDKSLDSKSRKNVKQTPKIPQTNFIDMNREKLNRKPGRNSYAAIYSQKIKMKQGNSKSKRENHTSFLESEKREPTNTESTWPNSSSRNNTFAPIPETHPSLSDQHHQNYYSNYYNVNQPYIPSANTNTYALPGNQPVQEYGNGYLSQPYHAPYKDFGLRYSNYGHQSYMVPNAAAYHRPPGDMYLLTNQPQGYSSQSAPPGIPGRQSLLEQVEFFPEQEHFLSQSLTNSQFINPPQIYQRVPVLERKFVSEPQLPVSNVNPTKDTANGYVKNQKKTEYRPYTLKDYRQIKNEQLDTLGSLGPDIETDEYKEKITKSNKQKEYAEILRLDHAVKKKLWAKKPAVSGPPARQLQAEAKRQAAINYARTVPKPKITDTNTATQRPSQGKTSKDEKDIPLIELMRMRHIKEKNNVDAIRKELLSKTQQ